MSDLGAFFISLFQCHSTQVVLNRLIDFLEDLLEFVHGKVASPTVDRQKFAAINRHQLTAKLLQFLA